MRQKPLGEKQGTSMVEAAITLPIVLLITFAMINLAIAWFVAVAASNAANYGARVGSVSQSSASANAAAAAQTKMDTVGFGSTYAINVSGGGSRGSQITVTVNWAVPNYIASLLAFVGGGEVTFEGSAQSTFRQEGW